MISEDISSQQTCPACNLEYMLECHRGYQLLFESISLYELISSLFLFTLVGLGANLLCGALFSREL